MNANNDFWRNKRILVTGGTGFIGSYVVEHLVNVKGVAPEDIVMPHSKGCDLRDFDDCKQAVKGCQIVIHLAAITGGISYSRQFPASQYYASTLMDMNMVEAACQEGVEKFLAIGNVFAYAPDAPMPLNEKDLFNGLPTDAHRGVGSMKRNLALLADLYHREHEFPMIVVFSANAYGPRDSFDPMHSHVIPATIMKCYKDEDLIVWGDGSPTRDFLYVEDIAEGLALAVEKLPSGEYINLGSGEEISIGDLVKKIAFQTGFSRNIKFDLSKVGGDARRCVDIEKAHRLIGFAPNISMDEGLKRTVRWYETEVQESIK
jgi:GDP-L-fucose synthase